MIIMTKTEMITTMSKLVLNVHNCDLSDSWDVGHGTHTQTLLFIITSVLDRQIVDCMHVLQ